MFEENAPKLTEAGNVFVEEVVDEHGDPVVVPVAVHLTTNQR